MLINLVCKFIKIEANQIKHSKTMYGSSEVFNFLDFQMFLFLTCGELFLKKPVYIVSVYLYLLLSRYVNVLVLYI